MVVVAAGLALPAAGGARGMAGSSVCSGLARRLEPPPVLTPRHPRLPRPTESRQMIWGMDAMGVIP
jgi:hypothetical protein